MLAVTFLDAGWLWLALALPLLWFLPRRLSDVGQGLLRTAAMLFLVAAIAQPVSYTTTDEVWTVVVYDGGGSAVQAAGARDAAPALGNAGRERGHAILVHGARAPVDETITGAFDRVVRVTDERSAVPLGAMLEAALRAIPEGARGSVAVLSDAGGGRSCGPASTPRRASDPPCAPPPRG